MVTAVTTVRIPSQKAARVFAAAEARAVALEHGVVLLEDTHDARAYLIHDDDGWRIEASTLFPPPSWADQVLTIIRRHGERD